MSARARIAFAVLAVAGVAVFVSLGLWQWQRGEEKAERLAQSARILAERAPQDLPEALAQPLAWVEIEGEFARQPALLLDNQLREGRAGVRVYRLFEPQSPVDALLVDLGWLPLDATRTLPEVPRAEGTQQLAGLLAPPPSAGLALGEAMQARDEVWLMTRLDPDAITQALSLRVSLPARVLRLDPAHTLGYARDLDLLPNTLPPERHRGYAVQWFGLAGAVAAIYLVLAWRARRRRNVA